MPADLGPEAEAWIDAKHAELLAAGRPVSKRFLRQQLVWDWEREEQERARLAEAPGKGALTMIRRGKSDRRGGSVSRSVLVDATVGEMVAGF